MLTRSTGLYIHARCHLRAMFCSDKADKRQMFIETTTGNGYLLTVDFKPWQPGKTYEE